MFSEDYDVVIIDYDDHEIESVIDDYHTPPVKVIPEEVDYTILPEEVDYTILPEEVDYTILPEEVDYTIVPVKICKNTR